jgi:rhamnosyl/mannosyltransferase
LFARDLNVSPKMRVLHVYKTYFPDTQGGLEECIRQICFGTTALGIENRVLSLSRDPNPAVLPRPEAELHRFKRTVELSSNGISAEAFSAFPALASWADVIHYHFPWPFADLLHLWHRPSAATVLTYHSDIVRQRWLSSCYSPVMSRFLDRMDRIVATSPAYAASSPVLSRFVHKLRVIPIGIDAGCYPVVSEAERQWARALNREKFFLFIGVLRYYKGLHVLLDAVAGTELRLVIAGSGPLEGALQREIARRGLQNVRLLGQVTDREKISLIEACTAIVLPSHLRSEAFGVSLLEGAMYGKPLISAEIGTGTSYINEHLTTGIVVPPGDALALREAMARLAHHPRMAEDMGVAARKRYELLFTGKKMGHSYYELYRELTGMSAFH